MYASEVDKVVPALKKPLRNVIYNAADCSRCEWLFNNLRMRKKLSRHVRELLPSGTASNEALHAEINNWFRQIQSLHHSTLKSKLNIMCLAKLLPHNVSLYSPTCRQMPEGIVLARVLSKPVWAVLPAEQKKNEERQAVRKWMKSRPSAAVRATALKRTCYNLKRRSGIKRVARLQIM